MKLEKGEITNWQLTILIISFMQGMTQTIGFTYGVSRQSTWITVLAAFVILLPIVLMYMAIIRKFPGQNLFQINSVVFGPFLGQLISAIYLWFFFQVFIHHMHFFNSFWINYIMPETPRAAFIIMFMFVCALAARKGLEVIARCSFLSMVIVAAAVLVVTVLLIGEMELSNLMPVLDITPKKFIQSMHIILAIPYCEFVVFLMILPYTSDPVRIRKPVLLGITLSVLQLLIVVLRDILVLGPLITNISMASFAVSRFIDIADVLTRLDILVAITMLITAFIKISIFYYATSLGLAQMLKLRSYLPLVIPVGIIAAAIAVNLYPSDMEQNYAGIYVWPFNAFIYELLLPIVTLIVIAVRRLPKKEEKEGAQST